MATSRAPAAGSALRVWAARRGPEALSWLLPVAVFVVVRDLEAARVERLAAVIAGLGFVAAASRRPDLALLALAIGLPFHTIVLSLAYRFGVPAASVRLAAAWKEALTVAVVVGALREVRRRGWVLDGLDRLGIGFVGVLTVYAVLPVLTPGAPGLDARLLGWRSGAMFVVLFLACRRLDLGPRFSARLGRAVLVTAIVVAGIALYELLDSEGWNRLLVEDIRVSHYLVEVLDVAPRDPLDLRFYGNVGGREIVRVGSVLLSPLVLGFYLVLGLALSLEGLVRANRSPGATLGAAVIGTAIVATQTRSAVLAAVVVVAAALRPALGRTSSRRVAVSLGVGAAVLAVLPMLSSSGFVERTTAPFESDTSADEHVDSFGDGVRAVVDRPLGDGLGTSAGIGQRFGTATVISENYYLQVANEGGVVAGALFLALVVALNRRLRRRCTSGDGTVAAARGAVLGISVGAALLHAWNDPAVSWTVWTVAGVALAATYREAGAQPPGRGVVAGV